ncbi:MAG: chlorophyll synthase ChlG, partial [Leptolyngbyaceae cyanobacterium MAG.088]|nr:chlorophyll synthase ChlG [Leptolyngbyaceae cyanobacterium MAG.088]
MADSDSSAPASDLTTDSTSSPAAEERGSSARQLLGMKGADTGDTNIWKIHLQLMKPITWVPLIWGVVCGAASS